MAGSNRPQLFTLVCTGRLAVPDAENARNEQHFGGCDCPDSVVTWVYTRSSTPSYPTPGGRVTKTAVYVRVSSTSQDTKAQEHDLRKWAASQRAGASWYRDKFTGTTLERPGLAKLLADVRARKVNKVVVWRLDRLGRTAKGLHEL